MEIEISALFLMKAVLKEMMQMYNDKTLSDTLMWQTTSDMSPSGAGVLQYISDFHALV